MDLDELVAAVERRHRTGASCPGPHDGVSVTHITHDSRRVRPGTMFCCVPGAHHDGHRFAPQAVADGAVALLCERELRTGAAEVHVPSVREAMGPFAAALHGHPSDHLALVGVTGTNGKTTTVTMLASILEAAGRPCGLIGTLTGARTTPEAPDLQAALAEFVAEGRTAVAMEVSSHALDLHRVDGSRFAVACFTNLSQDHLDHHRTMEAYFEAKARLFAPELAEHAVVDIDDEWGRRLVDRLEVPATPVSLADAAALRLEPTGSTFRWRGHEVRVHLAGRFNVANALVAATAASVLSVEPDAVAAGLDAVRAVAGRFEAIDAGQPFVAAVDYAHTPDGLRQLLTAARELTSGRVIVVFGAGGDRDADKRPQMGAAASELADVAVLTADNSRSEDPAAIIDAVRRGMTGPATTTIEPDRRVAIGLAVAEARAGDVVLVAGKGHETTQTVGSTVVEFDDRAVLREAIEALGAGGPTAWGSGS